MSGAEKKNDLEMLQTKTCSVAYFVHRSAQGRKNGHNDSRRHVAGLPETFGVTEQDHAAYAHQRRDDLSRKHEVMKVIR